MNDLPNRLLRLFEEVHCETPVEFISLALDMRLAVYTSLTDDEKDKVREIFPEFDIRNEKINFGDRDFVLDFVYKKTNENDLNDKFDSMGSNADNDVIGQILGYPKCCIKNHVLKDPSGEDVKRPRDPIMVCSGFDDGKPIPFVMNRFLNFSTRIRGNDAADYDRYLDKNKFNVVIQDKKIYLSNISFISHIPCSTVCKYSLMQADAIAEWMKTNMPNMYFFYMSALKRPFLYFGEALNFISFEGMVIDGNELRYTDIAPIKAFLDMEIEEAISMSDIIRSNDDALTFLRNDRLVYEYRKKSDSDGIIINFI